MARIMVMAMPFTGHVAPMLVVAGEAVARGHDVRFYTGAAFRGRVEGAGMRFVPWSAAPDFDENDLEPTFPRLKGRRGIRQLVVNIEDLFIRSAVGQASDLRDEWAREPWDVLVAEESSVGPILVTESTGAPWGTIGILPLLLPSRHLPPGGLGFAPARGPLGRARDAALRGLVRPLLIRPLQKAFVETREQAGLGPGGPVYEDASRSPMLIAASGCARLDFNPPPQLHYIGELASRRLAPQAPLPAWWGDVVQEARTVVLVTQGTQNVDPRDLVRPTLEALAGTEALVIATTGVRGRSELPFPVPANARVTDFLPFQELLPEVDLMVTNGGWGGTLAALGNGIPLVIAGGDLDKPEIAARVAWSGAGVSLGTGTPSAGRVGAAVERVLGDPSFREAARRLAKEMSALGGAARAFDLVEELLA